MYSLVTFITQIIQVSCATQGCYTPYVPFRAPCMTCIGCKYNLDKNRYILSADPHETDPTSIALYFLQDPQGMGLMFIHKTCFPNADWKVR